MSEYLNSVIKASGGAGAPAELLDSSKIEQPKDSSSLAAKDEKYILDSLGAAGYLVPEEQDLADALLEIVEKHGKFNDDNTGVWAGYDSAEKNAENAAIGVKCGNCVFFNAPNGCSIIDSEVEEGGLCRFAILPDGAVTADAGGYGGECPPATQDIQLNLENRQNAIDNVGYGPLNPAEPNEEFWQEKADRWNTDIQEAKSAVCGNCIFFIRTPKVLDCLETGIGLDQEAEGTIAAGELGYCSALDFKCASERTCNAWAAGGPITEDTEETMTVTASADETALEKNEDDPCWSGYVQVGMKNKNGKRVPNCVPTSASIEYIINSYNSDFGVSRQVSTEDAYAVARQAFEKYSYLENDDDVYSAIVYDLITYVTYATTAQIDEEDDASEFANYLPEGHPATESSLVASVNWVAGASDLDVSGRDAVLRAFSESSDYVTSLHASTRLRAVVAGGSVSEATLHHIKSLSERFSKVN
jgi:hypothetical protein